MIFSRILPAAAILLFCANSWAVTALEYLNYGNTLMSQGKPQEAAAYYQYAIQVDPNLWQAWQGLGSTQEAAGLGEGALVSYEKSMAINPANVELAKKVATMKGSAAPPPPPPPSGRPAASPAAPAKSRRPGVGVGRVKEGGLVKNIHNQVALGLSEMLGGLGRFDVVDPRAFYGYFSDAQKAAKGGLTLAPQAEVAKAKGLRYVLLASVLKAEVSREAAMVMETNKPVWDIRALVDIEYLFVDTETKLVVYSGKASGEASRSEARKVAETVSVGGVNFGGTAPKPSNFNDNVKNAELAKTAARNACLEASDDVLEAFPITVSVVQVLDKAKRVARIDGGQDLGVQRDDRLAYFMKVKGTVKAVGLVRVEEVGPNSSIVFYEKSLSNLIRTGMPLQTVLYKE